MPRLPSPDNKLVSIVVPTWNDDAPRLLKTLDSIVRQRYRPLEIIVVDDGSRVPFAAVTESDLVARHRGQSSNCRVRFADAGSHVGLAAAKNLGIRLACGEYVGFLDCGDWWDPEKLQEQISCFERAAETCGLVYCGIRIVAVTPAAEKELYDVHPLVRGDNLQPLLLINNRITGSNSTVLIRRSVFDVVGTFYAAEEIPEDLDLWARIAARCSIDFVDKILASIEKRPFSMSTDPEKKSVTYLRYYQLRKPEIERFGLWDKAMSQYYSVIGRKYFLRRNFGKGWRFFRLAAGHDVSVRMISRFFISVAEGFFGTHALTKQLYALQYAFSRSRPGRPR